MGNHIIIDIGHARGTGARGNGLEEHERCVLLAEALETALLRYLADQHYTDRRPPIISTGGGVVMREENRRLLRRIGFVVWLNVDLPILMARTARGNNRPLLQTADPEARMRELLAQRAPAYAAAAHISLNCSHSNVFATARRVCKAAGRYFAALRRANA